MARGYRRIIVFPMLTESKESKESLQTNTIQNDTVASLIFVMSDDAGEVLDLDAITGGFNLQAAWTMAYVVAKNL